MLYTQVNQYAYTSAAKLVLFIACPAIYFALTNEGRFRDIFVVSGEVKYIRLVAMFGFAVFVLGLVSFFVIYPLLDRFMIVGALANVGITAENYPLALAYYLLVNVALEELFFRGFLFLTIYRMGWKVFAHVYSAVLFAAYHLSVMRYGATPGLLVLGIIGLVFVGLLFNEITRRCNSAVGSYVVHLSASIAIGLIGAYYIYF